ncbi:MAG: MBOAT family O-acyltransferase [Oscillospiraceae bacterium]
MIFSSVIFLFLFLPFVLLGNFIIKKEFRNVFLLIISLGFYAWGGPSLVLVMLFSIFINYSSGLFIYYTKTKSSIFMQRFSLFIGVSLNLALLFYYKYFDFFISTTNKIFKSDISLLNIALPIGISFFTFQGMSYILDLYTDKVGVQKKFINIALYVSLFPQLIAGPIVRYKDINDQIDSRNVDIAKFSNGISRFVVGLSKKVIIANNMGYVADQIFKLDPDISLTTLVAWIGAISYSFQIYFDFSGYSDMAIGLGKMLGFDFLENFNYPYISKSITEFWRRWHISLSSWFRDYVYIPLGGNRRGNVYFNLLVVFLVTGLWHGASFNFIFWGLWHGMFLIIERIFKTNNINIKIPSFIKWIFTMLIVQIGWVLFRADSLTFAISYLKSMFFLDNQVPLVLFTARWYATNKVIFVGILSIIAATPILLKIKSKLNNEFLRSTLSNICIIFLFAVSIMLVMTSTYNPFIYFRF